MHIPAFLMLLASAPTASAQLLVPADGRVSATLNGHPGTVGVSPDGPTYPIFSADYAAKAGLSAGLLGLGINASVGPQKVNGRTGVATLAIGGTSWRRRVLWFDRPFLPGLDGGLGAGALPFKSIVFTISPPRPNERTIALKLQPAGPYMGTAALVGGRPVFVTWNLQTRRSIATADAGQLIAGAFQGALQGEAVSQPMRFGIARPVRDMVLAKPFPVGGVTLSHVAVRTADYGTAGAIPDTDADPGEVVVTAKGRKGRTLSMLTIGRDDLAHCSSIRFDLAVRQAILSCL